MVEHDRSWEIHLEMPGERPIRVLLVDDNDAFLSGASDWLEEHGVNVVGMVPTGDEAISAVERLNPDLVLMDLVMPGITGIEATRKIKSLPAAPWVVIVTFHGSEWVREEAAQAGAEEMVVKSNFVEELTPLIAKLSRERR